jgi:hypothetical protein
MEYKWRREEGTRTFRKRDEGRVIKINFPHMLENYTHYYKLVRSKLSKRGPFRGVWELKYIKTIPEMRVGCHINKVFAYLEGRYFLNTDYYILNKYESSLWKLENEG